MIATKGITRICILLGNMLMNGYDYQFTLYAANKSIIKMKDTTSIYIVIHEIYSRKKNSKPHKQPHKQGTVHYNERYYKYLYTNS